MDNTFWRKQTGEKPLFGDLLWSRPENRAHAGKLLIAGGNSFGFSAVARAYQAATEAGAGTVRAILPNILQKSIGGFIEHALYAPSTPSGSFAKSALADFMQEAAWSDCVLLAGDFGKNSETTLLLDSFAQKYSGPLTISHDALDAIASSVAHRPDTCIVPSMQQLQKLLLQQKWHQAITSTTQLNKIIEILHEFTTEFKPSIVVGYEGTGIVAHQGRVSTTSGMPSGSTTVGPANVAVWWMQNPTKPFEAATTALFTSVKL